MPLEIINNNQKVEVCDKIRGNYYSKLQDMAYTWVGF